MRHIFICMLFAFVSTCPVWAQREFIYINNNEPSASSQSKADEPDDGDESQPLDWHISLQGGMSWSFGDDSWNLIKDVRNATGTAFSLSVGAKFSRVFDARLKARYLKLYNRVNLEVLEAYNEDYPELFPRDGFYGFNVIALQPEAMLNLATLVTGARQQVFNLYLIGGAGFNVVYKYDDVVDSWDGSVVPALIYKVDTRKHFMPLGTLGGMIDLRICDEVSLNLELLSTFTGDWLEGVKSEEAYDVYITASAGLTIHF